MNLEVQGKLKEACENVEAQYIMSDTAPSSEESRLGWTNIATSGLERRRHLMAPLPLPPLVLALIALAVLPLSLTFLFLNYVAIAVIPNHTPSRRIRQNPSFRPKRVLITGVNSPYGLRVARAFHETGHDVVGADPTETLIPSPAAFSAALRRFYSLEVRPVDFAKQLLRIVLLNDIDLWIDCSQTIPTLTLAEGRFLLEQKTSCICFNASEQLRGLVSTPRKFLDSAAEAGLHVPEVRTVRSRDEVHGVLNQSRGRKKYFLGSPGSTSTALPRRTLSQTYDEVSQIPIQHNTPWVLEQSTDGLPRYTTFAILVHGNVRLFAACQSIKPLGFQIMRDSSLTQAMLSDVQKLARHFGPAASCHLRVEFCVEEKQTDSGIEQHLLPVDGGVVPDATGLAFHGTAGSLDLVQAYLATLSADVNGFSPNDTNDPSQPHIPQPTETSVGVYSIGYDMCRTVMSITETDMMKSLQAYVELLTHVAFWQDFDYCFRDPLPFWYLYQFYIPFRLLSSGPRDISAP